MRQDVHIFATDLYDDLKAFARKYLESERSTHTLQPTALVHETFLKLAAQDRVSWQCRTQFLAVAATTMRRVLVDYARRRARNKRVEGRPRVALEDACMLFERNDIELLEFDSVLTSLAEIDPRASQIVEYQVYAGLTQREIAEHLSISERTVREDWRFAKAWLTVRLSPAKD